MTLPTADSGGRIQQPETPTRTRRAESQRRRTLMALFADAETQANIRGSARAGYQAVTEYVDHFAPVLDKHDAATARATRLLTADEPAKIKRAAWAALTPA